jgi:hypothetical protein
VSSIYVVGDRVNVPAVQVQPGSPYWTNFELTSTSKRSRRYLLFWWFERPLLVGDPAAPGVLAALEGLGITWGDRLRPPSRPRAPMRLL